MKEGENKPLLDTGSSDSEKVIDTNSCKKCDSLSNLVDLQPRRYRKKCADSIFRNNLDNYSI